ncbi:MAG: PIG-L family deacetylase [Firmicutes bacterium]|nr:PIG-L family deacetylase [Bacillota bacterium]
MNFKNEGAEIFIPDGSEAVQALARTTYLAVSAHQDDIEIMAMDGILKAFGRDDRWFAGVVVTNGSGSPRDGLYAEYTDAEMRRVRKIEQKKAAYVGEYGAQVLLDYPSSAVKDPKNQAIVSELKKIISIAKPRIIYTHNLADKHDTHVAVALKVIDALRQLPKEILPENVFGCEVWRDLDWLPDSEKVLFDLSLHQNLAGALLGVFDSQISGGKRYDLATLGRRTAHATFSASHGVDAAASLSYGLDLTPLIKDPDLDPKEFIKRKIEGFAAEVSERVEKLLD